MRRWTRPLPTEPDRAILSNVWTTSTCYKPREIERPYCGPTRKGHWHGAPCRPSARTSCRLNTSAVRARRSTPMEPHKRTHLVNELMEEARLMQSAVEKAMEGQQFEAQHPALHGPQHAPGTHRLQEEHAAWEKV